MQPIVLVPLLLFASTYIFFASLIHIFGSDGSGRSKVNLVVAAICSAPGIVLAIGVSISSNDFFAYAAYAFMFIGPFIALFALGLFLSGRIGMGGWRNDALAMVLTIAFGGALYLLATPNS